MPEYLSPGVYIEEIAGPRTIEGVSTSTAGFVGMAERGPEAPQFIGSFLEFQRWFGGYIPDLSYLAYAVQGFFDNGGQRCYVTRVVPANAKAASGAIGNLKFWAIGRGAWGNGIKITVEAATTTSAGKPTDRFKLTLQHFSNPQNPKAAPALTEVYDNLTHVAGDSNNVLTVVNGASHLVRVWWTGAGPAKLPDTAATFLNKLPAGAQPSVDGDDAGDVLGTRTITGNDYIGSPDVTDTDIPTQFKSLFGRGSGLQGLEAVLDISLLAVPDQAHASLSSVVRTAITNAVVNQCERLKDRFAVISEQQGQFNPNTIAPTNDTTFAAFYYPWIWAFDPQLNDNRLIPPTGHVTGLIARTDIDRGVHKAPANEVLVDAMKIELPITKAMHDMLNPKGVNVIRDFRPLGRGIRLFGARTMSSDPEWKYVSVRRLFIFIEQSILRGTQWVVFEPNDYSLCAQVKRTITGFLTTVWKSGALMGLTQDEAFFVKCDRTTMTQDDIDNGRLICYIGIAPVKPAEFVIFRIQQKTMDAQQ